MVEGIGTNGRRYWDEAKKAARGHEAVIFEGQRLRLDGLPHLLFIDEEENLVEDTDGDGVGGAVMIDSAHVDEEVVVDHEVVEQIYTKGTVPFVYFCGYSCNHVTFFSRSIN